MAVRPVPDGFHTITPYLTVTDANGLLDFIKRAFNAKEHHVMRGPDGSVGHADLVIGDSHAMLGQWWMATHVEDVANEEMDKRMKASAPQQG